MSVTFTHIMSPTLQASSTFSIRWSASLEMWTSPSLPGASSTKAPKVISRTTRP